jgi:hypothetical protein
MTHSTLDPLLRFPLESFLFSYVPLLSLDCLAFPFDYFDSTMCLPYLDIRNPSPFSCNALFGFWRCGYYPFPPHLLSLPSNRSLPSTDLGTKLLPRTLERCHVYSNGEVVDCLVGSPSRSPSPLEFDMFETIDTLQSWLPFFIVHFTDSFKLAYLKADIWQTEW